MYALFLKMPVRLKASDRQHYVLSVGCVFIFTSLKKLQHEE